MADEVAPGVPVTTPWRLWKVVIAGVVLVVVVCVAVLVWSAPRTQVPAPGPQATPQQVVRAYVAAINARDFSTANAIDARPDSDLGQFSRPGRMNDLTTVSVSRESNRTHVVFKADFSGGDGSIPDGRQSWGYVLERGHDGRWVIVDEGVI